MKQNFVWTVPATEPLQAQLKLWDALERAMTYDQHMSNAHVSAEEGQLLVNFHYQGRDRWWIASRARTAMVAAMIRARLGHKGLELVRVDRLDSGHDLRNPNRTEAQQAADQAKTKRARWADVKAQRESQS